MKSRDVIMFLAGSTIVAAACAASNAVRNITYSNDSGTPTDGMLTLVDAVMDSMNLPEAQAQDAGSQSQLNVVACKANGSYAFAEQLYPGKTKEDIAKNVIVMACSDTQHSSRPPGYFCATVSPLVIDGGAAINCGVASELTNLSVTFIYR